MPTKELAIIVLAAGTGSRMKSSLPKILHPLAGRPMIAQVMATGYSLSPDHSLVIVSPVNKERVSDIVSNSTLVVQGEANGTGGAVLCAKEHLSNFTGNVLILFADSPLISVETLKTMVEKRSEPGNPAVVVMGFRPDDPAEYGRLVVSGDESLIKIVEARDAEGDERDINLCNSGCMLIDGNILFEILSRTNNVNAKGEYYLTDVVEQANKLGRSCAVVETSSPIEALGVNTMRELAIAERALQHRIRCAAMDSGVTMVAPETVFFSYDTVVGQDVFIEPNVILGPGVNIASDVIIRSFSHLEGCSLESGSVVGPFARIRPDSVIRTGAKIGNFVEIKKAMIEQNAKVNHLAYIGDARVGESANVGAGTITCNYDGFSKSFTDIGKGAFIGSNSSLVAPVTIGDGAIVGAGSTISKDVAAGSLALTRASLSQVDGYAEEFLNNKKSKKKS